MLFRASSLCLKKRPDTGRDPNPTVPWASVLIFRFGLNQHTACRAYNQYMPELCSTHSPHCIPAIPMHRDYFGKKRAIYRSRSASWQHSDRAQKRSAPKLYFLLSPSTLSRPAGRVHASWHPSGKTQCFALFAKTDLGILQENTNDSLLLSWHPSKPANIHAGLLAPTAPQNTPFLSPNPTCLSTLEQKPRVLNVVTLALLKNPICPHLFTTAPEETLGDSARATRRAAHLLSTASNTYHAISRRRRLAIIQKKVLHHATLLWRV